MAGIVILNAGLGVGVILAVVGSLTWTIVSSMPQGRRVSRELTDSPSRPKPIVVPALSRRPVGGPQ